VIFGLDETSYLGLVMALCAVIIIGGVYAFYHSCAIPHMPKHKMEVDHAGAKAAERYANASPRVREAQEQGSQQEERGSDRQRGEDSHRPFPYGEEGRPHTEG
jgi:hypothetical protein